MMFFTSNPPFFFYCVMFVVDPFQTKVVTLSWINDRQSTPGFLFGSLKAKPTNQLPHSGKEETMEQQCLWLLPLV